MGEKENIAYAYWLHSVPGIGNRTMERLLDVVGPPEEIFGQCESVVSDPLLRLSPKQKDSLLFHKRHAEPERDFARLIEKQISFVWRGQKEYPARLRNIPDSPLALYYKGKLPEEKNICVAVVGARDCTSYGRYVAEELGKQLAERGVVVVSGLARGVDSISQKAALAHGGESIAVMGCGVDVCYPAQNRDIYDALQKNGAIISEYVPGTSPAPMLFPPRNRIISGLSDVLVVVEARKKSGTLITVDMALEQGKDVYIVPGRVTDPLSFGCNELIRQGAGMITSLDAFVESVCQNGACSDSDVNSDSDSDKEEKVSGQGAGADSIRRQASNSHKYQERENAFSEETKEGFSLKQCVLELLDACPKTVDEIYESALALAEKTVSLQEILFVLLELCAEGRARQIGGCYALTYR